MLRWACEPDEAFIVIVDASLEISVDMLRDAVAGQADEEWAMAAYTEQTRSLFTSQELLAELEKLLAAHRSPKLYMPTDYHFLILYEVLSQQIDPHNDALVAGKEPREFGGMSFGRIDFDALLDEFFWDTDFLLDPEHLDRLPEESHESMGLNAEAFGVTHGLRAHPLELELEEVDEQPRRAGNYYKTGQAYPYCDEEHLFS